MTNAPGQESKNPTELLSLQLQALESINLLQLTQNAKLEKIRDQQEKFQKVFIEANQERENSGINQVKIIDFNMPFMALVGIIVKIALASIPAAIILTIVIAVIGLGITFIFGTFGAIISGLLG
jgi:hypothetical protein